MNKFLYILTLSYLVVSCGSNVYINKSQFRGEAFGTTYSIIVTDNKSVDLHFEIDSVIKVVNQSMSTYIPSSDISRINRGDTRVLVDHMFRDVFELSDQIYQKTGGYFDPTVGVLVNAWGFGPGEKMDLTDMKVDSLMQYVGYSKVKLTEDHHIVKEHPSIYFDFNAIAKGYAIDRLGVALDQRGLKNYLIEVGGEIVTKGINTASNKEWVVGIDDPLAEDRSNPIRLIQLKDRALASSGNYRKFRVDPETGVKYVHTINALTGYTQNSNVLAVSVLADNCATADGYATAFMAMGLEKTMNLVQGDSKLEAFVVYLDEDNQTATWASEGFKSAFLSKE